MFQRVYGKGASGTLQKLIKSEAEWTLFPVASAAAAAVFFSLFMALGEEKGEEESSRGLNGESGKDKRSWGDLTFK